MNWLDRANQLTDLAREGRIVVDPADPASIEEHLARLCPDRSTHGEVLRFLADALEEAHRSGPGVWKIAAKGTRVRLRVGQRVVYELKSERIRLGLPWQVLSAGGARVR